MPQVISIKTFYTSKRISFLLFSFFKRTSGLHKKNLSNQLSNPVPISVSELSNPSSRQNPKLLIKKI